MPLVQEPQVSVAGHPWLHLREMLSTNTVPARLLWLVVLVGGVLRIYHYDTLSLWRDEGLTIWFGRLPWDGVLVHATYENHPPLYFALVKVAEAIAPELTAGRLVSVVAGTLTLPLLYGLAARLLSQWSALLACAVLAVSPLHIWYSQEARPYALTLLLVGISYLALVSFYRAPRPVWAVLYGVSLLLSIYSEYSAIYALIPQVIPLVYITKGEGRRALWLWSAGLIAALAFLPWLPQLFYAVVAAAAPQAEYLGVTPAKVGTSILSVAGIAGNGSYYYGGISPWDRWPLMQPLFVAAILLVVVAGVIALKQRSTMLLLVAGGLLIGTITVGAALSTMRAGYAERTIIYAVLGWALMLGAVPFARLPRAAKMAGALGAGAVSLVSLVMLVTMYRDGDKEHWRDLAQDGAAAAALGKPLLAYPAVTGILLSAYQPVSLGKDMLVIADGDDLPDLSRSEQGQSGATWLAYVEHDGIDHLRDQLGTLGYRRIIHRYYWNPLYLDLYAQPGADLGSEVDINGKFAGVRNHATDWQLPAQETTLKPTDTGGREMVMQNSSPTESRAVHSLPAHGNALYTLSFEARSQLTSGQAKSFLLCTSSTGTWTLVAPNDAGEPVPNDGTWQEITMGALCPPATVSLSIDLRNGGQGEADFRDVKLTEMVAPGK
jgi:4-amino-4-deoxy-L-arabinose transferase-like glycosyltransferase